MDYKPPSFLEESSSHESGEVEKLKVARDAIKSGDLDTAIQILDDCIGEEGREAEEERTMGEKPGRDVPSFLS